MKMKQDKAQVVLELAITFIVFCLFILGIINIWVWGNAQVAGRNNKYENTRISAGSSSSPGEWPVYRPKKLEKDWVILD